MGLQLPIHLFLVCFPAQGHINPMLRLAKRLAAKGLLITFTTTEHVGKDMRKANNIVDDQPTPVGTGFIRFEFFEDGCAEDDPKRRDLDFYVPQLERKGKQFLPKTINKHAKEGRPVCCFVNNPFIPWVCDVAEDLGIPCATLWVQSCAVLSCYYHYFHGTVPFPSESEPSIDVQLPNLPLLKHDEIPSFLHPSSLYKVLGTAILGQFKNLSKSFCVLADTFDELEHEIVRGMAEVCEVKPVGPLFKHPKAPSTSSSNIRGDMLQADDDCIGWLDSKPRGSVVYISFGTIVYIKQQQVEEIAYGVLNSGVSFLWVMKPPDVAFGYKLHVLPDGFLEKVGARGKIVEWCPQEEVLGHPSVGCFVTHCGWNSTVEALSCGVPVVAFPQWGDQVTNAKMMVDVYGVGVRLCRGAAEDKVIPRDDIGKALVEAMDQRKMKDNAIKWKRAAEEAVAEGGSSDRNIRDFVEEIKKRSTLYNSKSFTT